MEEEYDQRFSLLEEQASHIHQFISSDSEELEVQKKVRGWMISKCNEISKACQDEVQDLYDKKYKVFQYEFKQGVESMQKEIL